MRSDELRQLDDAQLAARIAELEEERFRLRFRSATQVLEEPLRLRAIRKDIARLKTIQRERALGIVRAAAAPAAAPAKKRAATKRGAAKKTAR